MICPKCGHQRDGDEHLPDWQCPACGIAYHKYNPVDELADEAGETATKRRSGFRTFRIVVLLLVLVFVVLDAWLTKARTTDWDRPLRVVLYPINPDNSDKAQAYIDSLAVGDFSQVSNFMAEEAQRFGVRQKEPVSVRLGPQISEMPPLPPVGGSTLAIMAWSLNFRYWAFAMDEYEGPAPQVRVFITYYDPAKYAYLAHSTGLEKGMISIVKAFADERLAAQNNVVIAHEMLHTLGASDKYDLSSGLPLYPEGYAEPELTPRWPQSFAEIMGGKIPQSVDKAGMPESLDDVVVGPLTAKEIGWTLE